MRFADIKGNDDVKAALVGMADSGRIAHAMLFYENEGCGALPLLLAYFQYLNCRNRQGGDSCGECPSCSRISKLIHPDLHFVYPVNAGSKIGTSVKPSSEAYLKYWRELVTANPYFLESELYAALGMEKKAGNIAVAESKFILDKLSMTSVEDGYKAVVIWLPERMNAEAANRLLKIVEEPPEKTVFLFVTHAPEKVLQTIFSRCQSLRVLPLSKQDVAEVLHSQFSIPCDQAESQACVSGGSIGVALNMLGDREDYDAFMDLFSDMLNAAAAKDLLTVLETAETIASWTSREKQKGFCTFAGECIRKIFMVKENMAVISNVPAEEMQFFTGIAAKCQKNFCPRAIGYINKASSLLDRNVNPKIIFCDLADRIFLNI
ncbi:MAG: DNA polymerase III subunit delta [Bacteroidales bacterium]|nr:DNA polymerase III subunit delta [Bacteroidales bacterium]